MHSGIISYFCLQFSGDVRKSNSKAYSGPSATVQITISHIVGNDSSLKSPVVFGMEEYLCPHGYDQKCYARYENYLFFLLMFRGAMGKNVTCEKKKTVSVSSAKTRFF